MSLQSLRNNPLESCKFNVYRTGPQEGSFKRHGAIAQGGRCTIKEKKFANGFYDIKAIEAPNGNSDYFYPWLRQGVGWVKVPKNTANGTIVMTGGVNGCTIVVSEHGSDYYFYHDGDSKHLNLNAVLGNIVAKVTPKDYDCLNWGNKLFAKELHQASQKGVKPSGDTSYGHFIVAVKNKGRFGLYSTGLISLNGYKRLPNGLSSCLVTFG